MMIHSEEPQPVDAESTPTPMIRSKDPDPSFDIRSYIESHPGAIKGLFSGYQSDIESLLDSAGPARSLIEGSIKEKCPWLWSAVYDEPDSDLEQPTIRSNGNRHRVLDPDQEDDDEEGYDAPEDISLNDWNYAMEDATDMKESGMSNVQISKNLKADYGIDIHPLQISKALHEYYLNQTLRTRRRVQSFEDSPRRARTNDSILLKVSSLMADKKGLESKITELESKLQIPTPEKVGLIRWAWRKLW